MTQETAAFLMQLLDGQSVSVGAPDFDVTVRLVTSAKQELSKILNEVPSE